MMRLLILLVLTLLAGCQRYTIGAANAAPRVVSGTAELAETSDHSMAETHAEETADAEHSAEVGHTEDAAHSSASIPELDNALVIVQESFTHVRGSKVERHEAAEHLETAREALHVVAETGAISHWEDLDHYFETAIEKVTEGTNDAPNALHRLLGKLEKAGKH
jgi:hypothetical protein